MGWEVVKIKDIFDFKGGGTPSKSDPSFWNGDVYWASVKDIKGDYLLSTVDRITQKGVQNSATNIAEPGDVILITRISPGKTITTKIRAAINQDLKIVIPKYKTHSDFIKYLFKSVERKCIKLSSGTTVLGLALNNLNELEIPLPPLPEQHRIVAKIEELFSSLDKGIESLKTAQAQLKTYRQAVLKWAFEGKLTNENVKEGELPEGWKWVRLLEACEFITKGTTPLSNNLFNDKGDVPFIKVYNLNFNGTLNFKINPTFVSAITHNTELARSRVIPGDVLMNIVGPPLGKVSIVPNQFSEWNINQAIARFRCKKELLNKYLAYFLMFVKTIKSYSQKSKATAGQFNLTLEICRNILISIPPTLTEQTHIVSEIETRLSACDKLEESITQSLVQAEALRQSILKKAFEGKLVPQDPNDEPASILLDRIRAERASIAAKKAATVAKNAQVGTNRKGKRKRT